MTLKLFPGSSAADPQRDWYFIAEQPAPAPHLAHPEGCAALHIVLLCPMSAAPARLFRMDSISTCYRFLKPRRIAGEWGHGGAGDHPLGGRIRPRNLPGPQPEEPASGMTLEPLLHSGLPLGGVRGLRCLKILSPPRNPMQPDDCPKLTSRHKLTV